MTAPEANAPLTRWERLWSRRDAHASSGGDALDREGFLRTFEETEPLASRVQPSSLHAWDDERFAALLGDAGLGKSFELEAYRARLQAANQLTESRNLAAYGPGRLAPERMFDGEVFDRWRRSAASLVLLLDGFDESPLPPELAAHVIIERLRAEDLTRLRIRIASRPAAWTRGARSAFETLYGTVCELWLLPLRRAQVELALSRRGLALAALCAQGLGPLLARPLTLNLVLDAIGDGRGERTLLRSEVYERALRARGEAHYARSVPVASRAARADEAMRHADLLGAMTVFAGVYAFSMLTSDDAGSLEVASMARETPSRIEGLTLTLEGGPFTGAPTARRWEHTSFAEFHASRWLRAHAESAEARARWLRGPSGTLSALPSPVAAVAAWLAAEDGALAERLFAEAPRTLLAMDPALLDDTRRERLLRALLDVPTGISESVWPLLDAGRSLVTDATLPVLGQILRDRRRSDDVRIVTLWIALEAKARSFTPVAMSVVDDASEPLSVRVEAARLVAALGDRTQRASLRRFAAGALEDVDDNLKGHALAALWRSARDPVELVPLSDLLTLLVAPRNRHHWGAYEQFLAHDFVDALRVDELSTVLRDAASRIEAGADAPFGEREYRERLLDRAWASAAAEGVAEALADYLALWEQRRYELPRARGDREARRRVLVPLVARCRSESSLAWNLSSWVDGDDLEWLLSQAAAEQTPAASAWAGLAFRVFRALVERDEVEPSSHAMTVERFLAARDASLSLARESMWYFETGVAIDDPVARRAREHAQAERRRSDEVASSQALIDNHLRAQLSAAERDPAEHYWRFIYWAFARALPGGRHVSEPHQRVADTAWWKSADAPLHESVVSLSKRYLEAGDPATEAWFTQRRHDHRARAGYVALLLLAEASPQALASLGDEVWSRWMPVLIDATRPDGRARDAHERLLLTAKERAHEDFLAWVEREAEQELQRDGAVTVFARVPSRGDAALARSMLAHAADPRYEPARGALLALAHATLPAEALALAHARFDEEAKRPRSVDALCSLASFLVKHDGANAWPKVLAHAAAAPSFGDRFIEGLSVYALHQESLLEPLPLSVLIALWEWTNARWPERELRGGASLVSPGEELRGAATRALEAAASEPEIAPGDEALLDALVTRHGDDAWIAEVVRRARRRAQVQRWRPWPLRALLDAL